MKYCHRLPISYLDNASFKGQQKTKVEKPFNSIVVDNHLPRLFMVSFII